MDPSQTAPAFAEPSPRLFAKAFQILPDSAAILDATGQIVAVNESWRRYAAGNGGRDDGYVGYNYLGVCGAPESDAAGANDAALAGSSIATLLSGAVDEVQFEYPCDSPRGTQYFMMHAAVFGDEGRRYALVRHVDITERKRIELKAIERANHDDLTGLPTRAHFVERLEQSLARAKRNGSRLAVFALDLDGFKAINDTHGHAAGDGVLRAVAARLKHTVREVDALSRAGGDEFLLLAEDANVAGVRRLAERIVERLAEPIEVDGLHCVVGASLGAVFYPDEADTSADLLERADQAMYRAKRGGGGCLAFHLDERSDEASAAAFA